MEASGSDHVGVAVADLDDALTTSGRLFGVDPEPRQGLFGLEVAFVQPDAAHRVLTEVAARD